jgi:hypothetical protein
MQRVEKSPRNSFFIAKILVIGKRQRKYKERHQCRKGYSTGNKLKTEGRPHGHKKVKLPVS